MVDRQVQLAGLDWFAGLGVPQSLIDRAKEELLGGPVKPPLEKQPVLPAYGDGADDWDHIADEIKVQTEFGELVYVQIQAHNVAPPINQLSDVLVSAASFSTAMRAASKEMRDMLKPIAKYVADPKKAADEITAHASDSAVDKAQTAGAIMVDMAWADPIKETLDTVRTLADSLLAQVKTKLASLAKHAESKKVAEQAEALQVGIDALVETAKGYAEGGPEGAAFSFWASATKVVIPNPLKEQAAELEKEAQKLEEDGLNKLLGELVEACGKIDHAVAEVEKTGQDIAGKAGEQMKSAFTRYRDDAPKEGFNFDLFETALVATQSAVQAGNAARGLWAYLKGPWKELDEEFGKYMHVSRGREIPLDGERVGGSKIGEVVGSRADMVRNAKIKDRNAKTMAAIGTKLDVEGSAAEAAFAEANGFMPKLMALSSAGAKALAAAPGKHAKAS